MSGLSILSPIIINLTTERGRESTEYILCVLSLSLCGFIFYKQFIQLNATLCAQGEF